MKEKFIDFRGKVHTFFKEKTRFKARKYNDYLLIGVLLFLLLCMECALLIYNNFENVNVFGIFNDALIYFCILWLINAIQNIKAKKIFFGLFFSLTAVLFIVDTVFIEMFGHCFSVASLSAAGNVLKQDNFILFNKSTFIIIGIAVIGIASLFIVELRTQNRKNIIIKHVSIFMALAVALTVFNVTSVGSIKGRQYDDTLEYLSSDTFLYINFTAAKNSFQDSVMSFSRLTTSTALRQKLQLHT